LSPDFAAQAARNKAAAQADVARLVADFRLPPGSVEVSGKAYPGLGGVGPSTRPYFAMAARYWRVPLAFSAMHAWPTDHLPNGLTLEETSAGSGGGPETRGYTFLAGADPLAPLNNSAEFAVFGQASGAGAIWYVTAGEIWYDPTPGLVHRSGAKVHIDAAGPCAPSLAPAGDVKNSAPGLSDALLPSGPATGALICTYGGANGGAFHRLVRHSSLTASAATMLAREARQLNVGRSQDDSFRSCPLDDGSVSIVAFAIGGDSVDLWVHNRGCQNVDNGQILAAYSNFTLPQ